MRKLHKEYSNAFVLEPTKLDRLVGVIHERLADNEATVLRDHFEVFYSAHEHEEFDRLEDVVSLENSQRRRVQRLVLTCSAIPAVGGRPEHQVFVDFAATKAAAKPDQRSEKVVATIISSDASGWASRTLSEVEEQIERSWVPQVPHWHGSD